MGRDFTGPSVPHRTIRKLAVSKGTDARGFTESPPMEPGAGGSVAKAVSGGRYEGTAPDLKAAPIKRPTPFPGKNLRGG